MFKKYVFMTFQLTLVSKKEMNTKENMAGFQALFLCAKNGVVVKKN